MTILNSYDKAIINLKSELVSMGKKVELLLKGAMEALIEQNITKAQAIKSLEEEVDDLDYEVELKALEIISLQQPNDEDLRSLATIMRISKDLERIGDQAVNIAEITINLATKGAYFKELVDIPRMSSLAMAMLEKSLTAYMNKDVEMAYGVNEADDEVDNLYDALYWELIDYMKQDSKYVEQANYLILVARFLERVADHAVNVAEMTIYEANGERRPFLK
ncbi:MAG: phosphate signaling complex protein PhoU [Clostridia bacterium]|nr:phosphate signaling complex protein PhoU [Clostridia bacterium]